MSPQDLSDDKEDTERQIAAHLRVAAAMFAPRSELDKNFLQKAMEVVQEAAKGQPSTESARQFAQERMPELSALWRLIPETKKDVQQFWMLVCATLSAMLMAYQMFPDPNPTLDLPNDIINAIQAARPIAYQAPGK